MFRAISDTIPKDRDFAERVYAHEIRKRLLDGTFYDLLTIEFHDEVQRGGEFIPLRKRAPSVRYNMCRTLTNDSVSFTLGEGRFPSIVSSDPITRDAMKDIINNCLLQQVMIEAATIGSIGSVAVLMRVLKNDAGENKIYFEVLPTQYLTPTYDPNAPDTLLKVTQKFKVNGIDLIDLGYDIPEDNENSFYWYQRVFDRNAETHFMPMLVSEQRDKNGNLKKMVEDESRNVKHNLGFVPVVWIKNLSGGSGVDGACTFEQAIHAQIEIEYQLSQLGRALKYSGDPLLLINEAGGPDSQLSVDNSNTLIVGENGDGKLIESNGKAFMAVVQYVRTIRELALETCRGNRSSIDKLSLPQSGIALKVLWQPLISLADDLRGTYGEGLKSLLKMVQRAQAKLGNLQVGDVKLPALDTKQAISLRWPEFFDPSATDRQQQAASLAQLVAAGLMSRDTAVETLSRSYDIDDVAAEILLIEADQKRREEADALAAVVAKKNIIPNE